MGRSLWRVLKFVAWILIATAALLEGVLQAGAYVVYLANRPASMPTQDPAENTILCVGDSWTQGMGSSDYATRSYPAVLQELLRREAGESWTVVNGGQAGQNSRDVLSRLRGQLDAVRPSLVCVLVGRNDYWTNPMELTDDAHSTQGSYHFRWRLPRLLAFMRDDGSDAGASSSVLERKEPEWLPRPDPTPQLAVLPEKPWVSDARQSELRTAGWKSFSDGNAEAAAASFEAAIQRHPDDGDALNGLVAAHRKAGRSTERDAALTRLNELFRSTGSYAYGRLLTSSYVECGQMPHALELCRELLESHGEDPVLWYNRAVAEFQMAMEDMAAQSLDRCVTPWPARCVMQLRVQVLTKVGRMSEAVQSVYQGYGKFNDAAWARKWLSNCMSNLRYKGFDYAAELAAFECPDDVKARLSAILAEATRRSDGAEATRVLSSHLLQMTRVIRAHDATPVFLTYPHPADSAKYGQPMRDCAAEESVHLVDVTEGFRTKMNGRPWKEIASPDHHVNDEGYRFMAECVFEGLRPLLPTLK